MEHKDKKLRTNVSIDIIEPDSNEAKFLPPHIRKNKISNHYAIIIGEDGNLYLYLPMATRQIKRNVNHKLTPNPNKSSNKSSYVVLRLRKNKKGAFSAPINWELSPKDIAIIINYAKSKIKKRIVPSDLKSTSGLE